MQGGEQRFHPRIGDSVPERLGVAAEGDDALVPHAREMLRQRRLREADILGERTNGGLARFHQLAKNEQAAVVGKGTQQVGDFAGLGFERAGIDAGGCVFHIRYC